MNSIRLGGVKSQRQFVATHVHTHNEEMHKITTLYSMLLLLRIDRGEYYSDESSHHGPNEMIPGTKRPRSPRSTLCSTILEISIFRFLRYRPVVAYMLWCQCARQSQANRRKSKNPQSDQFEMK